jgi:hypothetical protein
VAKARHCELCALDAAAAEEGAVTAVLDPKATNKLAKICGMFGSVHEGERAAAAALADRMVSELGLRWADVISVPLVPAEPGHEEVSWQAALDACLEHVHELDPRSKAFVQSLSGWRGTPSTKQIDWIFDIYGRVHRGAA